MAASTQPCFMLLEMSNGSENSTLERTLVMPLWKRQMRLMDLLKQPCFDSMIESASLLTISNALVRFIKAAYRDIFCLIHFSQSFQTAKIMLKVLQSVWTPHYASDMPQ